MGKPSKYTLKKPSVNIANETYASALEKSSYFSSRACWHDKEGNEVSLMELIEMKTMQY